MNSRGLARLLSYWNRRAGGLPGVTRGCCSRLGRQGGNKQHTENSQNPPSHFSLPEEEFEQGWPFPESEKAVDSFCWLSSYHLALGK
jgi:hypothetical protein